VEALTVRVVEPEPVITFPFHCAFKPDEGAACRVTVPEKPLFAVTVTVGLDPVPTEIGPTDRGADRVKSTTVTLIEDEVLLGPDVPLVPVTVMENVPYLVEVTVKVDVALETLEESVTMLGLKDQLRPLPTGTFAERNMLPENPFSAVTVIVVFSEAPALTGEDIGESETEKSLGGVTSTVIDAV
jgi:hypothetical protein